tara:strand:- start:151 stop:675 length:525 start_codon:yes stop_codon:yes gene_type:complete
MTNRTGELMAVEWYAVRTRSRHEEKVNVRLQKKLFNVFLPKLEVWSRRKDRKKRILTPLFPGYLFVRCELSKIIWLEILKTFGVAYVVGITDEPTPIPENQIGNIKKVLDSKMALKLHPYVNLGDKVIVVDGPLQGAIGYYVSPNHEKGKLILSLDLLNRSVEVEIDGSSIERH